METTMISDKKNIYTYRVSLPLVEYSQQLLDEAPPHRNPHQNHGAAMAPVTVSHFSKNK